MPIATAPSALSRLCRPGTAAGSWPSSTSRAVDALRLTVQRDAERLELHVASGDVGRSRPGAGKP